MVGLEIKGEVLNIKKINKLDKNIFFRKVTPKFFSHDEDEYHIESKVELVLDYVDNFDNNIEKVISFYQEHQIEYIGQEVEVEIEEFVELLEETPEYMLAKELLFNTEKDLKKEFL